MLRRAAGVLARQQAALQEALGGTGPAPAWRALQQTRAVHLSATAQLADAGKPVGESAQSTAAQEAAAQAAHQQGATESVVFGAIARAAAAANAKPASGVPGITRFLGFAGALPFWVFSPAVAPHLPLDLLLDVHMLSNPGLLQVGYGATILSFLGGVHWGLAMTNVGGTLGFKMAEQRFIWSVLPCLMAWPTIAMPVPHAAGVQAALLGAVYLVDKSWAGRGLLPPWYIRMRLPLTLLAASGLVLTAATS
ncbi:conserved membrane [Micractinium conductrix]|uniref:Conserved membrane n=1 Tax=Micractinium conductrix TaxID=554055 RepID=A0A2P6VGD7_9CHLO|nr:conserved membrane [Micractinium conductrix]|eukprot:PSC73137.1 conserved membrane [Micractinium conductrix]